MRGPAPVPGKAKAPTCTPARVAFWLAVAVLCGMGYILVKVSWYESGLHRGSPVTTDGKGGSSKGGKQGPPELSVSQVLQIAKALDPELMQHALPQGQSFLPDYKNPCWRVDGQLRCLPYVYITGSFQAGASTLYQRLSEHPDIITNDYARWQFWAEDTKPMREFVEKHGSGRSAKELEAAPSRKVILDGSASTFAFYWSAGLRAHRALQGVLVPCWRNCSEAAKGKADVRGQCMDDTCYPRAMAADESVARGLNVPFDTLHVPLLVSAAYGGSYKPKLIILLRDPIDRIHCAYWNYAHYHGKYGKTAAGFLAYVKEQVAVLGHCTKRFVGKSTYGSPPMDYAAAERHCALYLEALGHTEEQLFFHADQFMRSMYSIWLEVWLRHFPRDSLLVLKVEDDYFGEENAGKAMDSVYKFLGLEAPTDAGALKRISKAGRPYSTKAVQQPMLPEARTILHNLFKPYNEQLAKLLKDDRWLAYNKA